MQPQQRRCPAACKWSGTVYSLLPSQCQERVRRFRIWYKGNRKGADEFLQHRGVVVETDMEQIYFIELMATAWGHPLVKMSRPRSVDGYLCGWTRVRNACTVEKLRVDVESRFTSLQPDSLPMKEMSCVEVADFIRVTLKKSG